MMSQTPARPTPQSYWSIDNVRTYATLAVLAFHTVGLLIIGGYLRPDGRMGVGLGLDIFFILSGFLVWDVTRKRQSKPLRFIWKRFSRIAPFYWVLTLSYVLFLRLGLPALGPPGPPSQAHLLNALLFIPDTLFAGMPLPVLPPAWTLIYDMYFFVIFGVVLAFPVKRQLLAATVLFSLAAAVHFILPPGQSVVVTTYTNIRALSFLAGIWMAEGVRRGVVLPRRIAEAGSVIGLLAYGALFACRIPYHSFGVVLWMAAADLAVFAAVSVEMSGSNWRRIPHLSTVARWAYATYLGQVFAIPVAIVFTPGPLVVKGVAAVVLSVAFGAALNRWVERPLGDALKVLEDGVQGGLARFRPRKSDPAAVKPAARTASV